MDALKADKLIQLRIGHSGVTCHLISAVFVYGPVSVSPHSLWFIHPDPKLYQPFPRATPDAREPGLRR